MLWGVQVPPPHVVTFHVVEATPALLNLNLVFAVSEGTVNVRVHEGFAARVTCTPSAWIDVGITLHPETDMVGARFVPIVERVTGCAG